jgi:ectoine hydroxylase-related dioxygenase (phytanoyl-CoA dioxygenase family)
MQSFHKLSRPPVLYKIIELLLGSDIFVQPRKFLRLAPPGKAFETEPHQDYRYVQGSVDTLTVWIPLHDVDEQNAPLRFLPGSHHKGLWQSHQSSENKLPQIVDISPHDHRWVTVPANLGDVIIFHSLTVHAALPNCTQNNRFSIDVRYQRLNDYISHSALLAPYVLPAEEAADPTKWTMDPNVLLPESHFLVPSQKHDECRIFNLESQFCRFALLGD